MGKLSKLVLKESLSGTFDPKANTWKADQRKRTPLTPEQKEARKLAAEKKIADQKQKDADLIRYQTEEKLRATQKKQDDLKAEQARQKKEENKLKLSEKAKQAAEDYKKIVEQNKKRDADYAKDMSKDKDHEKIKETEKEPPHSSGLLDTAVRSLRF